MKSEFRPCKKCGNVFNAYSKHRTFRKICFSCRPPNLKFSKDDCLKISKKYNNRWEFQKKDYRCYRQSLNNDWLDDICSHMDIPKSAYTLKDCKEKALLCKSNSEFYSKYKSHYNSAHRNNWLKDIRGHFKKVYIGFSKSGFIARCEENSDKLGTLYLLECCNNEEHFYKIGITSTSVKKRYCNGSDMKYKWKILWQIKSSPKKIWNLENKYKTVLYGKNIKYVSFNLGQLNLI